MTGTNDSGKSVGEVAHLVGVTVRTLHHWDSIGLVKPSERSYAGYRLYSDADIEQLQRVLIYRETGMELVKIQELVSGNENSAEHLERQRYLLMQRLDRLGRMLEAVDTLLEDAMAENNLTPEEKSAILGDSWRPEYEDEAQQRWGETDEWRQSQEVQSKMSASDWESVKSENDALNSVLAEAMARGVEPGSEEANALAEKHRASLSQWFDVTHSKHVLIAMGYTDDDRFRSYYDKRSEGLANWIRKVIEENARANGVDPENPSWA